MMNRSSSPWPLLLFLVCFTPARAGTDQSQSHAAIIAAAKTHLLQATSHMTQKSTIDITPLDHRLRLIQCDTPLETFSPAGASTRGRTTVGVRCSSPKPWTLYVSANIGLQGAVVVATHDLSRGSAIGPDDVRLMERDTSHLLRGYFDALDQVVGRTVKRTLHRDQVITPNLLRAHKTISRGQKVTILAGSAGIEVRMQGKALRQGNPGDLIPVQNMASKKKLEARVISAGTVRVN